MAAVHCAGMKASTAGGQRCRLQPLHRRPRAIRPPGLVPSARREAAVATAASAGGALSFGSGSGFPLQQAATAGSGGLIGHQLVVGATVALYGVAALALAWVLFREEDDNDSGGGGGPGNGVPIELYVRVDDNEYDRRRRY